MYHSLVQPIASGSDAILRNRARAIIEARAVKTTEASRPRGYETQKIKGRCRLSLVDTDGRGLDARGASGEYPGPRWWRAAAPHAASFAVHRDQVFADRMGGEKVATATVIAVEIVRQNRRLRRQPRRWVVAASFGQPWINRNLRLAKDFVAPPSPRPAPTPPPSMLLRPQIGPSRSDFRTDS